ncbi:hypothetical protein DSB67_02255 [Vibrio campbellii]|nr:hypothetical protein DSB67_02255 [Vibrio campbellii]
MGFIHYSTEQARYRTLTKWKAKPLSEEATTIYLFERHTDGVAVFQGSSTPHPMCLQFNVFNTVI